MFRLRSNASNLAARASSAVGLVVVVVVVILDAIVERLVALPSVCPFPCENGVHPPSGGVATVPVPARGAVSLLGLAGRPRTNAVGFHPEL